VTVFVKRYCRNRTFQDFGLGSVWLRPQEVSVGYRVKRWGDSVCVMAEST